MKPVEPLYVCDSSGRAIAVQIKYEDWLEIEAILGQRTTPPVAHKINDFAGCLKQLGDGVEYQRRVREEWP